MNWENTLDYIGIGLCLVVAGCLAYNRIRCGRLVPGTRIDPVANDFHCEVSTRMMRQQALEALSTAAATIREEQQRLQRWDEIEPGSSRPFEVSDVSAAARPNAEFDAVQSQPPSVHAAILGLLQRGVEEGEIAARLGRPRAEIALCRKLSRMQ